MSTKFGHQNPWPGRNTLLGSKVIQGSFQLNHRSSCLEISHGYQIWSSDPWSESIHCQDQRSHRGHPTKSTEANLLRSFYGYQIWSKEPLTRVYRLCQKKLYNFQSLIAEVKKAQLQHYGDQNIIFLCVRFLNGIIPWSGVKVMVHWVMSGKNKVGHFRHYCESYGSSLIGETHSDLR